MRYFIKQPGLLRALCSQCVWSLPTTERRLFLTFDDGPAPEATAYTLELLRAFEAKATFFCRGDQVAAYPDLYKRILHEGHDVGNHSWSHPDGWRTRNVEYYADVQKAQTVINSNLFRPPYGRILPWQVKHLKAKLDLTTVMWSITSGDFDPRNTPKQSMRNVLKNAHPGAIVLLHNSDKMLQGLRMLPELLSNLKDQGYDLSVSLGRSLSF